MKHTDTAAAQLPVKKDDVMKDAGCDADYGCGK